MCAVENVKKRRPKIDFYSFNVHLDLWNRHTILISEYPKNTRMPSKWARLQKPGIAPSHHGGRYKTSDLVQKVNRQRQKEIGRNKSERITSPQIAELRKGNRKLKQSDNFFTDLETIQDTR